MICTRSITNVHNHRHKIQYMDKDEKCKKAQNGKMKFKLFQSSSQFLLEPIQAELFCVTESYEEKIVCRTLS